MKETRKGMLLVISGPSGAGKGTLVAKLLEKDPSFCFSDGRTVYTVWSNDKPTRWIAQLQGPEGMIFTLAEKKEAYKNDQLWGFVGLVLIWLLTLLSFLFSLRIGRDPDRFRSWIRKLFFRDDL